MDLSDYIIDEDFIYLVRPRYNRGNIFQALTLQKVTVLNEQELHYGANIICQALNTIH